jgi:hypothetical protein
VIDLQRILVFGVFAAALVGIIVYIVLRGWGSDGPDEK